MPYVIVFLFGCATGAFGLYEYQKRVSAIVAEEISKAESATVRELSALHGKLDRVLSVLNLG